MNSPLIFIFVSVFSRLGDLLAVISIPLFLYEKTADLSVTGYFTIVLTITTMLVSKYAANLLKKYHPLKIIFVADSVGAALLVVLALYATYFDFNLYIFLLISGLMGLALNVPHYCKSNLLHEYFVPVEQLHKYSLLQGRMLSIAFVFAISMSAIVYGTFSLMGVLILDVITYIPLLYACYKYRRSPNLGYVSSVLKDNAKSQQIRPLMNATFVLFLVFAIFCFFFASIRSHMLVTLFKNLYPTVGLMSVALFASLGILVSLMFSHYINSFYKRYEPQTHHILFIYLVALAVIFYLNAPVFVIAGSTFLLSEIISLLTYAQRKLQVELSSAFEVSALSFNNILYSCIFSSIFLFVFLHIAKINYFLAFFSFAILFYISIIVISLFKDMKR